MFITEQLGRHIRAERRRVDKKAREAEVKARKRQTTHRPDVPALKDKAVLVKQMSNDEMRELGICVNPAVYKGRAEYDTSSATMGSEQLDLTDEEKAELIELLARLQS